MTPYRNSNGNSNIESYEITDDSITVRFDSGDVRNYLYTSRIPGAAVVTPYLLSTFQQTYLSF